MLKYLEQLLKSLNSTFVWFVIVFIGFMVRTDTYGVSSIIRALSLMPVFYPNILHFFHSSAFTIASLRQYWWQWITKMQVAFLIDGKIVLIGENTKNVKCCDHTLSGFRNRKQAIFLSRRSMGLYWAFD